MNNEPVLYHAENGVAIVTLNRPDQRNAINPAVCDALRDAFDRAEGDKDVRAAILTGAGKLFCAGMDLKAFAEGAALAGGFEMMLTCDMAIAGQSAQFALPEVRIGLIPGAGGAIRLPHYIPRALANELLLTGKPYGADQMAQWGVLNKVTPDGEALTAAKALASEIAQNAPLAVRGTLEIATRAYEEMDIAQWPSNDQIIGKIGNSADATEGARAFIEKRPPVWKGE
ncbi:enoyl-CoA hydratase-related protein [Yoonia sp. R2-816]|uniref:enoyl-CoA hydratase-related protein n=1 Tax=Yoonia sp. R2-816 TaxID=3342638 RepID=UPI0037297636